MQLSEDNLLEYLSVTWALFILGLLPCILQQGMDTQVTPAEYHAGLLSVMLLILGCIGNKKHQLELHPEPTLLGFAIIPIDSITFDEAFRRLIEHEGRYKKDKRNLGNWAGGKVGIDTLKGTKFGLASNTYMHLDIKNIMQVKAVYKKIGGINQPVMAYILLLLFSFGILQ